MPAKVLSQALSGMPQMSAAFADWKVPMALHKINQQIVSGFVYTIETAFNVIGTWQPLDPETIALKPEGQRAWEWIDLHIEGTNVLFKVNDRIIRDGLPYKIMALRNYSLNNFVEYHLIRDYEVYVAPEPIPGNYVTFNGEIVTYNGEPVTYTLELVTYNGEQVTYLGEPVTIAPPNP